MNDIELNRPVREADRDTDRDGRELLSEATQFSLPRADGGKDAWLVLAGCFILEALVWGE